MIPLEAVGLCYLFVALLACLFALLEGISHGLWLDGPHNAETMWKIQDILYDIYIL